MLSELRTIGKSEERACLLTSGQSTYPDVKEEDISTGLFIREQSLPGRHPHPAQGMGGSMALLGAAFLAEAFQKHPGDFAKAFQEYDKSLRPIVDEIQTNAIDFGLKMFLPASQAEIDQRNAQLKLRQS